MLNIKSYDANVSNTFKKYIELTGLNKDSDFYHSVSRVECDVKFFQEYMDRTPKKSGFSFEPKLAMRGLIYQGFFDKINSMSYSYNYEYLSHYLYIFEVLKRLLQSNWVEGVGANEECAKKIIEFHPVVTYYLDQKLISDYIHDFIGSSYGADEFMKSVNKISFNLQTQ